MISSVANPSVKRVRRLRKRLERERRGLILVEGIASVSGGADAGAVVELYLTTAGLRRHGDLVARVGDAGVRANEVTLEVMGAMSTVRTPPDVLAVATMPGPARSPAEGVILSNVRDPASAGGIMAVTAAVGMRQVVGTRGTVDLFEPRVVRAGLGAHFRVDVIRRAGEEETIGRYRSAGARIVALMANGGISLWDADLSGPLALVVCGTDDEVDADVRVSAPVNGSSVGARAAMTLYERKRQTR